MHDLRSFVEPQQGTSYDAMLAHARTAERLGFDAWFTSDHLLAMGGGDPQPGPSDAWTTLAGLARDTSTIRLGTLVSPVTFRSPGQLAVQVAQVDAMSGGRVELGLGSGWYAAEHAAMGMQFPSLGERFNSLEEYVQIITGLWATPIGETFSFEGEVWSISENPGLPKPVQRPGVPIVAGGGGKVRTPRLAARYAAEWNSPFKQPDEWAALAANVRAACEAIDRDPHDLTYSVAQVVCIGRDEAELARRAAVIGREVGELRASGVCGLPGEARARLDAFRAHGCERFYLQTLDVDDLEHLELIAEVLG
jgi:F420-dependent oxidoreductase-like protein